MSAGGRPLAAEIALALLGALALAALAGCGGGGGGESTSAAPATQKTTSLAQKPPAQGKQNESAGKPEQDASPSPPRQHVPEGHPTPGAKAVAPGVPTTRGGDNSIQAYGAEGESGPRSQAVEELTAYLAAFSAHEWAKACSVASSEYRKQLAQLVASAKTRDAAKKPESCPATLVALVGKVPGGALDSYRVAKALSFRIEGDHAFLIYKNPEGKAMFIAMKEDEGEWKVNVLQPEPFSAGGGK